MTDNCPLLQRRTLSAGRQLRAVGILALIAAGLVVLGTVFVGRPQPSAAANRPVASTDRVTLSAEQLATLGVVTVQAATFHDSVIADGQIAVNADTATEVFSPYSGRVIRVLAAVGDKVRSALPPPRKQLALQQDLLASGNTFWTAGASLSQTLFAGGALWHHKLAPDAALDAAGAQYRAVALAPLQNVADTLDALQFDDQAVVAAHRAEVAARQSLEALRAALSQGSISDLELLNAQQAHAQVDSSLQQARGNRLADTVALFAALGGGWWNRPQTAPPGYW